MVGTENSVEVTTEAQEDPRASLQSQIKELKESLEDKGDQNEKLKEVQKDKDGEIFALKSEIKRMEQDHASWNERDPKRETEKEPHATRLDEMAIDSGNTEGGTSTQRRSGSITAKLNPTGARMIPPMTIARKFPRNGAVMNYDDNLSWSELGDEIEREAVVLHLIDPQWNLLEGAAFFVGGYIEREVIERWVQFIITHPDIELERWDFEFLERGCRALESIGVSCGFEELLSKKLASQESGEILDLRKLKVTDKTALDDFLERYEIYGPPIPQELRAWASRIKRTAGSRDQIRERLRSQLSIVDSSNDRAERRAAWAEGVMTAVEAVQDWFLDFLQGSEAD